MFIVLWSCVKNKILPEKLVSKIVNKYQKMFFGCVVLVFMYFVLY